MVLEANPPLPRAPYGRCLLDRPSLWSGPERAPLRVLCEVPGREMRVAHHHVHGRPSSELLKMLEWRFSLYLPARPGMAQIVEAETGQPGRVAGVAPGFGGDLLDRRAARKLKTYSG